LGTRFVRIVHMGVMTSDVQGSHIQKDLVVLLQKLQEHIDDLAIKLGSLPLDQLAFGMFDIHLGPILPVGGHGIKRIDYGYDPGQERNLLTLETLRISQAVDSFMVILDDRHYLLEHENS